MDYQSLGSFVALGALIIGMFNMLRKDIKETRDELSGRIDNVDAKLSGKIDNLAKEVHSLDNRMSNIEGQMTQMTRPQVIQMPIDRPPSDDAKEN